MSGRRRDDDGHTGSMAVTDWDGYVYGTVAGPPCVVCGTIISSQSGLAIEGAAWAHVSCAERSRREVAVA